MWASDGIGRHDELKPRWETVRVRLSPCPPIFEYLTQESKVKTKGGEVLYGDDMGTPSRRNGCAMLIGRYQPLTRGHRALIQTVLDQGHRVVVALRDTVLDDDNPFTVEQRREMIEEAFGDSVEICVVPDVNIVVVGRDVGYKVIRLSKEIEAISATEIRNHLREVGEL